MAQTRIADLVDVGENVAVAAIGLGTEYREYGQTARKADDPGDLPTAQGLVRCSRPVRAELLTPPQGELIDQRCNKALRNIMGADGILQFAIVIISPLICQRPPQAALGCVVHGLGPLIG